MKGFDCSTPLKLEVAKLFASGGFTHACRYLVPSGWKRLTREEAENITTAGLKIVSVFETTANRPLGGSLNGSIDGKQALQAALAVGQTKGTVIYFAVDFETQPEQIRTIQMYLEAAAYQIKGYEIGVYGSYAVVEAMKIIGIKYLWQTKAWSKGKVSPSANIYQADCGPKGLGLPMNGISVDLDEIYINEGGWDTMQISKVDADAIIKTLSKAYMDTSDTVARTEYHRLANIIRTASNQPPT